jgi:hypothetical protein
LLAAFGIGVVAGWLVILVDDVAVVVVGIGC